MVSTAWNSQPHDCLWSHIEPPTGLMTPGYQWMVTCTEDFFKPQLESLGYKGIFWPKACSPAEQYGYPCDGCAIFYRADRLELIGLPQGGPIPRVPAACPPESVQQPSSSSSSS